MRTPLSTLVALVVALLAPLAVVVIASDQEPADAYCVALQEGDIQRSWGAEDARTTSTCDGDGTYLGKVLDKVTDGACVNVRIREVGGSWWTQASGCTTGAWTNYTQYGSVSKAYEMRICKSPTNNVCSFIQLHETF